jgi:hypothetical protein
MKKLLLSALVILPIITMAQTSCGTAIAITANGTISASDYTTSTFSSGCLATKTNIKAKWYSFTAVSNGEITISSDLAANDGTTKTDDTRISVFKGTCAALSCIGSNDDISATNYLSSVTVPVAAGSTYYIQWDNYWYVGDTTGAENLGLDFTFNFSAVSCVRPSNFDFYLPDTYTTTSAKLYWNQAIGSPANYDTDWSVTMNAAAGTGTIVNTSTLFPAAGTAPAYATSSISGIPASSNVRYFVRSNCGANQSAWQGPFIAYLAKTLPYTTTFDDVALNYTDGFVGFSRLTTNATSNPANYADGGAGTAMYTFNSTTAVSNSRAYTRAISLQAGEVVTFNFKTRLFPATAVPMTFNVTVGNSQSSTGQTTVIQGFTENSATAYTARTVNYTAPTTGIYHFGFHNNSPVGTVQSFLFFDTLAMTSVLSNDKFNSESISIYPNPATDVLNISGVEGVTSLVINDINGRTIKTVNDASSINVSDLTAGVYFVNITSENGNVTKKFMKN